MRDPLVLVKGRPDIRLLKTLSWSPMRGFENTRRPADSSIR
jgi:hypothetical protein